MTAAKKFIEDIKKEISAERVSVPSSYIELVKIFPLSPITTKKQYKMALKLIEKLITNKISDQGIKTYTQMLSDLIYNYEQKTVEAPTVSGHEMLAYLMKLQDLTQADLAKELGGQSVVSQVVKGERKLNLRQIKALAKRFKVSPEVFM